MIDIYQGIPRRSQDSVQVFYNEGIGASAFASTIWQTWKKPKSARLLTMYCIGSGGGGGGANGIGNNGVAVAGAGGGGSAGYSKLVIPAMYVPDELYISVGQPGYGGTQNFGGAGFNSFISVNRGNNADVNCLLRSGNAAAGGGSNNTTGGSAGSVAVQSQQLLSFPGTWSAVIGIIGGAGNATNAVNYTAIPGTYGFASGRGGAGHGNNSSTLYNGGSIVGAGPIIDGCAGGLGTNGGGHRADGKQGSFYMQYMYGIGGGGGGNAYPTGKGGDGGDGGIGCGGGGSGVGNTTGANSGKGGWGGSGLVIMIAI